MSEFPSLTSEGSVCGENSSAVSHGFSDIRFESAANFHSAIFGEYVSQLIHREIKWDHKKGIDAKISLFEVGP